MLTIQNACFFILEKAKFPNYRLSKAMDMKNLNYSNGVEGEGTTSKKQGCTNKLKDVPINIKGF